MTRTNKQPIAKRKGSGSVRNVEMSFRITPDERIQLERRAEEFGVCIATYIRLHTLGKRSMREVPNRAELIRIAGELGKIGSNINQIAKYFNQQAKSENPEAAIAGYAAKVEAPLSRHFASVTAEIEALKAELGKL